LYKAGLAEASATPVRVEGDRAHDERAMNECKEAMVALNGIDKAFIARPKEPWSVARVGGTPFPGSGGAASTHPAEPME
jgi:hypothetical protein